MTTTTTEPNMLNRTLAVIAAVADVSAVSALIAQFLRQDTVLVLAIVAVSVILILILSWLIQRGWIDRSSIVILGILCLASIIIAAVFWASLASVKVTPIQIKIDAPQEGEKIDGYRYVVKGTVNDPNAGVYVVVRPLEPLDYWVQERPTVDATGNWQVNAYFGERSAGVGEGYEVIALATRENFLVTLVTGNFLRVGKTNSIPDNTNRSNLATVTRTR